MRQVSTSSRAVLGVFLLMVEARKERMVEIRVAIATEYLSFCSALTFCTILLVGVFERFCKDFSTNINFFLFRMYHFIFVHLVFVLVFWFCAFFIVLL